MPLKPPRAPPASSEKIAAAMMGNRRAGTRPEMLVRTPAHRLGYRFRTQVRALPGCPDLVFTRRRKIVQVYGCFWHQHDDPACPLRSMPRTNTHYWRVKLARNAERHQEQVRALEAAGWTVLIVWECECKDLDALSGGLTGFLGSRRCGGTSPKNTGHVRL